HRPRIAAISRLATRYHLHPGYDLNDNSTTRKPALLVHHERLLHPARRQIVRQHLRDRLENLELVAFTRLAPERHNGLERWTSRQPAGQLHDQHRAVLRELELRTRPTPHCGKRSNMFRASLEYGRDPVGFRHR